ncbi:MAG: nucleotidyltransferase family protein [Terriglobales bacterium]
MPLMAAQANRPELQLLLACARLSPDFARVQDCASGNLDWRKVVGAAEYHGLTPLLLKNLLAADARLPEQQMKQLEQNNARTVRQNLLLTSELLRAVSSLSEAGVEAVPLKGPALATRIYGDIGLRPFSDIDLLIRPEQIAAAEAVALKLGYEPEISIPAAHRDRWLKQQCELTFRRAGVSRLEFHWDISHPHFALGTGVDDFWSRSRTVQIGDSKLSDLSEQDLLFTLIVHGTRHGWSRLMWLVDLAELLGSLPHINWKLSAANAEERGAARMIATALVLVRKVFDVSIEDGEMESAYADAAAPKLANAVVEHWNQSLARDDTSDLEPGPMWRHRWIMQTRENREQRWTYALRVMSMVGEEEFGAARLPGAMSPLYKAMRFWNIFRKARPKTMAATSAQGKS